MKIKDDAYKPSITITVIEEEITTFLTILDAARQVFELSGTPYTIEEEGRGLTMIREIENKIGLTKIDGAAAMIYAILMPCGIALALAVVVGVGLYLGSQGKL